MTVRKLSMADTRPRLPDWFRTSLPTGELQRKFKETKDTVTENTLHTVCQEARGPNIHECWAAKDATFMVAGQECIDFKEDCSCKQPPTEIQDFPSHSPTVGHHSWISHLNLYVLSEVM